MAVWSSCLWPVAVRGEEYAVALSTTPDSTSANAWPARPCPALPRQDPGSIQLRAVRSVPSDAGVRANHVAPCTATRRAAVLLIETDSISVIGPMDQACQAGALVITGWVAMAARGSRGIVAVALDRCAHGSPPGLVVGSDDGFGVGCNVDNFVSRLDCSIAADPLGSCRSRQAGKRSRHRSDRIRPSLLSHPWQAPDKAQVVRRMGNRVRAARLRVQGHHAGGT